MAWQLTPYTVPLSVTVVVTMAVFVFVFRNRTQRGAWPLLGLLFTACIWTVAVILQLSATATASKIFWNNVRFLGPTFTVVSIFLFAASFTGRRRWLRWPGVLIPFLPVVVVNSFVWTNDWHGLLRIGSTVVSTDPVVLVEFSWGPLFFVHALYQYFVLSITVYWLLAEFRRALKRGTTARQTQAGIVLFATLVPWGTNVLFVFDFTPIDFTPFGFAVTGALFAVGLFHYRLLDLIPIARRTVVERMDNGVLVLNARGTIVDANPRASRVFGIEHDDLLETHFEDALSSFPSVVAAIAEGPETRKPVSVQHGGTLSHYELATSSISESLEDAVGRVIVLNDITEQIERERELAARETELDLMRQVQSRVLRHNLRNNLQVVKANNERLASHLDGEYETIAEQTVRKADELLVTSQKARAVERVIEREQVATRLDIVAVITGIVEDVRDRFPGVSVDLDAPAECVVETVPATELALENIVENAAEHNDAPTPEVHVSVTVGETNAIVHISDNGPGIPEHELGVIERGEETALKHGRGIGLWVVERAVAYSDASIRYDSKETGTDIHLEIPLVR